ncbi:EF-hand domain-containing protein D2-like [Styela clava]|uniref:EF-hand domain-containing protein D2-like n=1 Tax=Styela clava TaxID=7725 RepID=UPI0019398D6E|nr:EF-hand domain-containing protein D2-like [Styela clava]
MADSELSNILNRRNKINEGEEPAPTENVVVKGYQTNEGDKSEVDAALPELANKLNRQANINDGIESGEVPSMKVCNVYTEFKEFTRKQIKEYEKMFKKYDTGRDGFIDLMELKYMMEKLDAPQTHLGLKAMIKEVDEDYDSKMSFREFLLIFRKASNNELQIDGLKSIADCDEINVSEEGVGGAKNFFEAKVQQLSQSNKFEEEIKKEQEERRQEAELKKVRRAEFKAKASVFQ